MEFASLRLAGFKSFVEPAELRFAPGLTGVVGPNGCGKSNLLEAIRWTMGESSPRSLRGGGMEDVIFAGSATRPSRQFAEVRLTLDNGRRAAPAPWHAEPSIEVTRRIERGLGSAYRVNGRDVRQRDVQLLFADAGSGAHSPALVGQGRIAAIVNARPVERRALLEEAAGIAGLNVRRNEAEIRLRAAEANLGKLDEALGQQAAQAAALKRAARQAERYTALSDRIQAAEARQLHARWRDARTAAGRADADAATAGARATEAARAAALASTVQAQAAAALPALRAAERAAQDALAAAESERADLVRRRDDARRRLVDLDAASHDLARDRVREAALVADADAALARLDAEATLLAARSSASAAALPALAAAVASGEAAAATTEAALAAAIAEHARAQAQARAADAAITAAEGRARRDDAERARLAALLASLEPGVDPRPAARLVLAEATTALARAREAETAADTARGTAVERREASAATLSAATATLTALTAERDALARLLAPPTATPRATPLADLVRAAPGYEAALAAALGDDLDAPLGPDGWSGAEAAGDPSLPPGVEPLGRFVDAPPELARRLEQTGVVTGDAAAVPLRPGQRLVSRDGELWRWDGYRAAPGRARPAADRLIQRNRMDELEPLLAAATEAHAVSTRAAADAAAAHRAAIAAEADGRAARARAEPRHAAAVADLARLDAAAERDAGRRHDSRAALARLAEAASLAQADLDAARAERAAAGDLAGHATAATAARAAAEAARARLAEARAAHDARRRQAEADRTRHAALAAERAGWSGRADAAATRAASLAARAEALAGERTTLAAVPGELDAALAGHADRLAAAAHARTLAGDALARAEADLARHDAAARAADAALATSREALARAEADAAHARARADEAADAATARFGRPPAELPAAFGFDPAAPDDDAGLAVLRAERDRLGPVNLRAAIELDELESGLATAAAERAELETAIARLRGSVGALNREGRTRLLAAFRAVDGHFRDLYGALFAGGEARLELTESDDPLDAGLELMAQPPGKALTSLSLLSGGEQALTACALIFALFLANPAPLCVLDEVDAPLDDANVERFCDLLDQVAARTGTRFLIVTHNAVTMSRMHRLFGVTMAEPGVSQLVSVDLARAEALLLAAE